MPAAAHKGSLTFGLVHIPVSLHKAVADGDKVSFNQLDRETKSRIRYKKVRESDGQEVQSSDIIKGYQIRKDEYVLIEDDFLESIKTTKDKSIQILYFVPVGSVGSIYFDTTYYVIPDHSDRAFQLLREAMIQCEVQAIGRTVLGTQETLMLLSPSDEGIEAVKLFYHEQIRAVPKPISPAELNDSELSMASAIIEAMRGAFDPAQFHDEYQAKLRAAIQAKDEGREVVTEQPSKESNIINLMDMLKGTMEQMGTKPEKDNSPTVQAEEADQQVRQRRSTRLRPVQPAAAGTSWQPPQQPVPQIGNRLQ